MISTRDPDQLTRAMVLAACTWPSEDIAVVQIYSALFDRVIEAHILAKTAGDISDTEVALIADVMRVPAEDLPLLRTMLWHDAMFSFEAVSYGCDVLEGESEFDANKRDFEIHTPEDAFAKSTLKYATIQEPEEQFVNRYATFLMECPWGDLNDVIIKNGRLVDVYENGAYVGFYEPGAKYAETPSYLTRGQR